MSDHPINRVNREMEGFTPSEKDHETPDGPYLAYEKKFRSLFPLDPEYEIFSDFGNSYCRYPYIAKYGFAIPNQHAINRITKLVWSKSDYPLVEMGAGLGWWAHHLKQKGVDITCYDNFDPAWGWNREPWVEVLPGSYEKITNPCHVLLIWPPYNEPFATEVLKKWLETATEDCLFFFVGELGGCTGDDEFFELLEQKCEEIEEVTIPSWPGVRDRLFIYSTKKNP